MKKSFIMFNAHNIRRHAAGVWHVSVSAISMSECLKMAWQGYTAATLPTPAAAIRAQYEDMSDDQRERWIAATCRKFVAHEVGASMSYNDGATAVENLSKTVERYFLNLVRDGWQDLTQSAHMGALAYIRTPGRLEAINVGRNERGYAPITLGAIIWRAAHTSVQSTKRDAIKQARMGFVSTVNGETGEVIAITDKASGNDFAKVDTMDMLYRACKDSTDKRIIDHMYNDGYTQTEIAVKIGISQQAIAKRIAGIRKRCAA